MMRKHQEGWGQLLAVFALALAFFVTFLLEYRDGLLPADSAARVHWIFFGITFWLPLIADVRLMRTIRALRAGGEPTMRRALNQAAVVMLVPYIVFFLAWMAFTAH